jgi:hypothetical protein
MAFVRAPPQPSTMDRHSQVEHMSRNANHVSLGGAPTRPRQIARSAWPSSDTTVNGRGSGPIDGARACNAPINTGPTQSNRAHESKREPGATWGRTNAAATISTLTWRRQARIIPSVGARAVQSKAFVRAPPQPSTMDRHSQIEHMSRNANHVSLGGALTRPRQIARSAWPSSDNTVNGRGSGPIDGARACNAPINTGPTQSNREHESKREPGATWRRPTNADATIRTLARQRKARTIASVGAGAGQSMAFVRAPPHPRTMDRHNQNV